jgi:hypothetical protein
VAKGICILITAALLRHSVLACPICDSPIGKEVRNGIFENFTITFLSVMAPFPVLIILAGLLTRVTDRSKD